MVHEITEIEPGVFYTLLEPCSTRVLPHVLIPDPALICWVVDHSPHATWNWVDMTLPLADGLNVAPELVRPLGESGQAVADGPLAVLVFLLIHVVIPAGGLLAFVRTTRRMEAAGVGDAPVVRLLVLCATYGGWLLVGLTGLFWYWSGMASIGLAYLVLIAPLVMLGIAAVTFRQRATSGYHRLTFWAAAAYPPATLAVVALLSQFGQGSSAA